MQTDTRRAWGFSFTLFALQFRRRSHDCLEALSGWSLGTIRGVHARLCRLSVRGVDRWLCVAPGSFTVPLPVSLPRRIAAARRTAPGGHV